MYQWQIDKRLVKKNIDPWQRNIAEKKINIKNLRNHNEKQNY